MKSSTVLVVLGVASGAVAVRCNQGLTYCGSSLLKKGNYRADIVACLEREGQPTTTDYILYSRFLCTADEDFLIWVDKCPTGGCMDNGSGRDDTCA